MILAAGVAVLDCIWLVAFHVDAAGLILALNATIAIVAAGGFLALRSVASRRPEGVVFATLVAVDAATFVVAPHLHPSVVAGGSLVAPAACKAGLPCGTGQ